MAEANLRGEIHMSEEAYWANCFFDTEYNRRLFFDKLKFPGYESLWQKDEGTNLSRRVRISPPVDALPGPVKKIAGNSFNYEEEGTFDKGTKRYSFVVHSSTAADKSNVRGEMWVESVGGKLYRCAKLQVDVKIFMVGGMIESKIIEDFTKSFEAATILANEFAKEKGL